jgi:hypothetical protein
MENYSNYFAFPLRGQQENVFYKINLKYFFCL